jgi:hypothetical protein
VWWQKTLPNCQLLQLQDSLQDLVSCFASLSVRNHSCMSSLKFTMHLAPIVQGVHSKGQHELVAWACISRIYVPEEVAYLFSSLIQKQIKI